MGPAPCSSQLIGGGGNSSFFNLTSAGGGGGGGRPVVQTGLTGVNGGSGGGKWMVLNNNSVVLVTGNTPPVSPPQGNPAGVRFQLSLQQIGMVVQVEVEEQQQVELVVAPNSPTGGDLAVQVQQQVLMEVQQLLLVVEVLVWIIMVLVGGQLVVVEQVVEDKELLGVDILMVLDGNQQLQNN